MKSGSLVFVAHAKAFAQVMADLDDFAIFEVAAAAGYMKLLIDRRAALVFVDGDMPGWRDFVIAPKASAATRRIPLLVVSDFGQLRAEAIAAGADLALSWSELARDRDRVIADFARLPDAAMLARLACECEADLPPLALAGLREFEARNYYRQHDLFEEAWVATAGPVRDLYRAILQVGIAYYQIERGNYRGALKMLQRSVQWLQILPDACQGVDVAALRRDSYALRAALEELGAEGLDELDRALLKPIRWTSPET